MATDETIREWARLIARGTPALDSDQQRIAFHAYRLIASTATPVPVSQIAAAAELAVTTVEGHLRSWPLVLWDDQDRVMGFWGLHAEHLTPTHSFEVDGSTVFTWCAWDPLFITEILGQRAHVTSTDPHLGTTVRLTVSPGGVTDLDPPTAVLSFLIPEHGLTEDAIQSFCHKVHFFESKASADAWIGDRPGMFSLTVDEAFELGRAINTLRMGTIVGRTGAAEVR